MTTPTPENAPPGTEIVCVVDAPVFEGFTMPEKGVVYTVRQYVQSSSLLQQGGRLRRPVATTTALLLNEIVNPPTTGLEPAMPCNAFRLLHRAASPQFYTVKAPVDAEPAQ